ncbi:MAG: hypothetical protein ACYTGQ_07385 [Planctomycetota bacterium]
MLHITCPQCESGLEVDEGFRGGVCRCSQCGSLLTVPDEKGPQIVESLGRPDVPDGAVASPDTYQTKSGRKLTLSKDELSEIPVAKRHRPGVRLATMAAVLVLMAGILAGFFAVTSAMFSGPEPVDVAAIYQDVFHIVDNPYLTDTPSFMGLPVANRTIFMIDGSATMRDYLDLLTPAVTHAFQTLGESEAQVVIWNENAPTVWPEYPMSGAKIDTTELLDTINPVTATGGVAALDGVTRALMSKPELIILVARQLPDDPTETDAVVKRIRDADAPLTAVIIDGAEPRLEDLATQSGGAYIELTSGQLQRWYQEFRNAGG